MMREKPSPTENVASNLERLSFLTQVEKQHDLVSEIVEQIQSLQTLSESLVNLFNNTDKLPPSLKKAFHLLDTLDDEQKTLSTNKIELRLEHLEIKIRAEVSNYLELINAIDELSEEADRDEKLKELTSYSRVSEFKRKVSLALAYHVLLFERDVPASEFSLDVAPELLSSALKKIESRKTNLKADLVSHFSSLRESIVSFAKKASTSKQMSLALHRLGDDIEVNLLHLKSGKPSEDLPTSILEIDEQIKLASELKISDADNQPSLPDEATRKQTEKLEKKQGLLGRINVWVSTPDSTKWKDTKKK